ncbi:protein kinase [Calothrix sp. PCC 7507]|uniref:protein kinase domain-containing protein n=1 Tax=Calothrix sp. PCC 7507 TaxID=99598 RepID=UPI00029F0E14|nr:protein kinase [Calothrix sp. PCC 7507]AFY32894.1 serine/threonine protein kinase [Calothrix sp. PCC 7507]
MSKLVLISIDENFDSSLTFRLQIFTEGDSQQRIASAKGKLPPAKDVHDKYLKWQSPYSSYVLRLNPRFSAEGGTASGFIDEIKAAKQQFESSFNEWLQPGYQFSPIREALLENLKDQNEDIRVIFEIENLELQRLPWHLWHYFFERYHRAEVALAIDVKTSPIENFKNKVTILSVLGKREAIGNVTRINIEKDWEILKQLAQNHNAIHIPSEKPYLEKLYEQIDEHKPHIFFFAGHSRTEKDHLSGIIELNDEETITIEHLKPKLKQAVKWGLQLAIFNSCDGLGIGRQLAKLHVPNIIVMREPVPDEVAQKFLRCFLEEFVQGKPLNRAVRRAREGITYLEYKFPGATWLPVIFQNSAAVPLTWQQIQGIKIGEELQHKQSVSNNLETKIQSEETVTEKASSSSNVVLPLVNTCQSCGVVNPSTSKFCNNCGFNLSTSSTKLPVPAPPQPDIPATIVTPILPNVPVEIASLVGSEPHSGLIICPACNHPNPEGNVQCEACYTPLSVPDDIPELIAPLVSSEPHSGLIICPACNHPNPEGNVQCEACYTPLHASLVSSEPHSGLIICPSCNHPNPESNVQCEACYTPLLKQPKLPASPPSTSSLMILDGRYKIIRQLGAGGFGKTFLAEDTYLPSGRRCVIKQLRPIMHNPRIYQLVQERFQREAAILEDLGSTTDQIPSLYAYFQSGEQFYLVQEWIEGNTLTAKIQQQGFLHESAVRKILVNLLPVIEYIHSKRIIHRDIKPDNIILRSGNGKPVLIDFGAVREIMQGNLTSSIIIGTPGFMPMEQSVGRPVFSTDLYSLGLTAIYLLTGKLPSTFATDPATGDILWQNHTQGVSPDFVAFLDKAIQQSPRDRYPNAREMLAALQNKF